MADPVSWGVLNEDFEDITDWVDGDAGAGASTEDPAGQLRLYVGAPSSGSYAMRQRSSLALNQDLTIEIKIKFDNIGNNSAINWTDITLEVDSGHYLYIIVYESATANRAIMRVYATAGSSYTSSAIKCNVDAAFAWIRITTDYSEMKCSVYYSEDGIIYRRLLNNVDFHFAGAITGGIVKIFQFGYTLPAAQAHLDYIKIASGIYTPTGWYHEAIGITSPAEFLGIANNKISEAIGIAGTS